MVIIQLHSISTLPRKLRLEAQMDQPALQRRADYCAQGFVMSITRIGTPGEPHLNSLNQR